MMLSLEDLRAMSDGVARTLFLVFGGGAELGLFFFPLQRCKRNTGDQVVGVGEDCVEVNRIGGAEDGSEKVDAKGGMVCAALLFGFVVWSVHFGRHFVCKCTGIFKDDSVYTLYSSFD